MSDNYTVFHLHSDLSNGVTNIDSVTKYKEYITAAKECGMKAMGFSCHGSLFEWYHKKEDIEAAGMKYIHGIEAYLTETLDEKIRDNMHCILIAKNYAGFLELNALVSQSFCRTDNHFYYVPRISLDELFSTSDNIIITTACVGGVFGKGNESCQSRMIEFLAAHPDRCFLEIGHHLDPKQVEYNKRMLELSHQYGVRLIAGTDTHVLNATHERGRLILQKAKKIHFDGEEMWDLKFHNYQELVTEYQKQSSLDEAVYLDAIENTNVMADMVEPFEIDCHTKYPHIYQNPEKKFREEVYAAIDSHPHALKYHTREELVARVDEELAVYEKTGAIDFMLLELFMRQHERSVGIQCGPGRGSVSGSMVAYLLGITDMDSMRFNLNFFRFMNPDRVTNADIDTDYGGKDRDAVKMFLLQERMGLPQIRTAEIITFNTIALKGAIRDVARALEMPKDEATAICNACEDEVPPNLRKKYPELFDYVDIVNGTIVSIGTHPSGVLVSDKNIDALIGTCSIASSPYPVSMLNMKELDAQMWVKLDILGLDNVGVMNETCKLLGIPPLKPDNIDLDDMDVWRSIRDDTTLIFQWESNSSQAFLKKFMSDKTIEAAKSRMENFSMMKWMSFGNGLIRPACASFRDSVADGEFYDNGFKELNDFLAPEAGRIAMQETIMQFLVKFCGYTNAESDSVRRAIAKKKGTETLLPEIKSRFIEYSSTHFDITAERCAEVIEPFIQVILDASAYAFSWNHSDSYSFIGYACGYLRYYHPVEFLTAALNIFGDDVDKTSNIIEYAKTRGITITSPKFGISGGEYTGNVEKKTIAKGLSSVRYLGSKIAEQIYAASQTKFDSFTDVLYALHEHTDIDARQLSILIHIDFFSEYGNQRELEAITSFYDTIADVKQLSRDKVDGTFIGSVVQKYASDKRKDGQPASRYTLNEGAARQIIKECEQKMLSLHVADYDTLAKVRNFADAMGYAGYVSGKPEDRPKLYIKDIRPLKRKKDGEICGYSLDAQSIGSGIERRWVIWKRAWDKNEQIDKGDLIYCQGWLPNGKDFEMTKYRKIYPGDEDMEALA